MNILVLPKYHEEGSSSRYRYYNYFDWFQKENHTVTCKSLLYNGYVKDAYSNKKKIKRIIMTGLGIINRVWFLLFHRKKFDIIIIEKELATFMPFILERLLLSDSRFIVDYDDNINARYQTGWARLFLSKKIERLGVLANSITVGNHWYMEFYKTIDLGKLHYLPTVIDGELYSRSVKGKEENLPLKIVWIGSPSTIKYLNSIDDILATLQSQYNFTIRIIGAEAALQCRAEFLEWNATTEIELLKQADIGIMPLENTDWEKGKCGLKLIQYMACGLPVVASYSVANNEIVGSGAGFIVHTKDEWLDALSQLLQSTALRNTLGENGKARIYNHYTYQIWGPVFTKLITDTA